jgi:hypothetical protein
VPIFPALVSTANDTGCSFEMQLLPILPPGIVKSLSRCLYFSAVNNFRVGIALITNCTSVLSRLRLKWKVGLERDEWEGRMMAEASAASRGVDCAYSNWGIGQYIWPLLLGQCCAMTTRKTNKQRSCRRRFAQKVNVRR